MTKFTKLFFAVIVIIWVIMLAITTKCITEDEYKERFDNTWY